MAQNKTTSAQKNGQQTVTGPVLWKEGPPFAGVDSKEASPLSLSQGAHTVARDRWERLSVVHEISASPEEIWHALTNPEALSQWFGACHGGSLDQSSHECVLDFEDGEFFLCRGVEARPPYHLQYRWRWMGIGPVWTVTWQIEPISENRTRVAMHEDALNPPNRWQHWNGEGWPGILDQLALYVRLKVPCRWPWRREAFTLIELDVPVYEAWDRLFSPPGLKYWLQPIGGGVLAPGQLLQVHLGDASGTVEMEIKEVVAPSFRFYPSMHFTMRRAAWNTEVPGRMFLEPAGWGRSVLQMFQYNWENLPAELQRSERQLLSGYWGAAMERAAQRCQR